jgi:hypothetical protein
MVHRSLGQTDQKFSPLALLLAASREKRRGQYGGNKQKRQYGYKTSFFHTFSSKN